MSREELIQNYPILARHWPDFPPPEPPHARDLKLRRDVERLHYLPARVTFEFLTAVGVERSIAIFLEDEISAFADLDPDALAALGARDLPPVPLHEVPA